MNWAAYFQADGEHRHTIAVRRFKHTAEFDTEQFVARMTNPEVGVWWVWVEETNETITGGRDSGDSSHRNSSAEQNDCQPAADHSVDDPEPGVHGGS